MRTVYYQHDMYNTIVRYAINSQGGYQDFERYVRGSGWVEDRDVAEIVWGINTDYHGITHEEAAAFVAKMEH